MSDLKATQPVFLRYLLNEDLYLIEEIHAAEPAMQMPETVEVKTQPETIIFDYLGENNKYYLLLVNYTDYKIMAPKELEALQSILSAKKLDLNDVAILNLSKYPSVTIQQLKAYFACNKVVLFGVNPAQLHIPAIASNEVSEYDGMKLLGTFNFTEMMDNIEKKKIFWNVMKGF